MFYNSIEDELNTKTMDNMLCCSDCNHLKTDHYIKGCGIKYCKCKNKVLSSHQKKVLIKESRLEAIEICKKQQQGISNRILRAYFADVIQLRDNISLMNHFLLDRVIKYLEATIND